MMLRARWWIAVSIFALGAAACGSSKGGDGPPSAANEEDLTEPEPDEEEEVTPVPGVCKRLCCSSLECAEGETCIAFDTANGTLGACSGTGLGPEIGAESPLPEGCWSANEPQCNPLTGAGCEGGAACDFGESPDGEYEPVLGCYGGDNTEVPGAVCDNAAGPWCLPGYHCVPN
jgi:hypothetical protein